jgi:hypothetical protein
MKSKFGSASRFGLKLENLEHREVPAVLNNPPVPFFQILNTTEDNAVTGVLSAGDLDPGDFENFVFTVTDQPDNGSLMFAADGRTFTYTPNANYNNTEANPDFFAFVVSDGKDTSDPATVRFLVSAVNDVPTLAPATFSLPENTANGTVVGTVLGADVENDPLTYSIVGGNTNNAFAINPTTGVVTVNNTTALDFETTPTFTLTVQASDGVASVQAPVTINLTEVVENTQVGIDIRPGTTKNLVNTRSNGKLRVAILSTSTFDARTVNVESLRFGRTGTENSISRRSDGRARFEYCDVDCDGRLDLVVKFEIRKMGFVAGDTVGKLTGTLISGVSIFGEDSVRIRV